MKKFRNIISLALVLSVCAVLLTGCARTTQLPTPPQNSDTSTINTEKVNTDKNSETTQKNDTTSKNDAVANEESKDKPGLDDKKTEIVKPDDTTGKNNDKAQLVGDDWEVIIRFDDDGLVTDVTAYNDETHKRESFDSYNGRDYNEVVDELVTAIKKEGYYVGEVDREIGHVTIEIDDRYDRDYDKYDKYDKYDDMIEDKFDRN